MNPKIAKLLDKYKQVESERFFKELFENGEYSPTLDLKADVVLDIGACAGEFSAYIYDKAKTIYAIEPYQPHFKELEDNVREFELTKIKPFNLALADFNGTGKLSVQGRGGHLLGEGATTVDVKVQTLATFMKEQKIEHVDILKIDIEGNEAKVFDSPDFVEVVDKIDYIIGEHLQNVGGLERYGFIHSVHSVNHIYKR